MLCFASWIRPALLPYLNAFGFFYLDTLVCLFLIFKVNHGKYPKQEDSYAFEEDSSSESLSPEQPHSEESQGFAEPLLENKTSGSASPTLNSTSHVRNSTVTNFGYSFSTLFTNLTSLQVEGTDILVTLYNMVHLLTLLKG